MSLCHFFLFGLSASPPVGNGVFPARLHTCQRGKALGQPVVFLLQQFLCTRSSANPVSSCLLFVSSGSESPEAAYRFSLELVCALRSGELIPCLLEIGAKPTDHFLPPFQHMAVRKTAAEKRDLFTCFDLMMHSCFISRPGPKPLQGVHGWLAGRSGPVQIWWDPTLSSIWAMLAQDTTSLMRTALLMAGWLEGAAQSKFVGDPALSSISGDAGTRHNKSGAKQRFEFPAAYE
jgi:hypothetical protein